MNNMDFITTNSLEPTGPASELFIAGASVFEITPFLPPLQRVTILGINLPDQDTFGPYQYYVATIAPPDDPDNVIAAMFLEPTPDMQLWAATTFLEFSGTLPPMNVYVRPQLNDFRIGPVILQGPVLAEELDLPENT